MNHYKWTYRGGEIKGFVDADTPEEAIDKAIKKRPDLHTDMFEVEFVREIAALPTGPVMPYRETHQHGTISLENIQTIIPDTVDLNIAEGVALTGDLGIQIAQDGRVWVNINGISFLRFTPTLSKKEDNKTVTG